MDTVTAVEIVTTLVALIVIFGLCAIVPLINPNIEG